MSNSETLRIFGTSNDSIVDGPGLRFTIFTQGCVHDCPGCHNPESHDLMGGYEATIDELWVQIAANPLLDGVTFSGGEPFLQPKSLVEIARRAKEIGLNIWAYTGYLLEDLVAKEDEGIQELLQITDVLVDGPFCKDECSLELRWRGSANQRIIDVASSLATRTCVCHCAT